jgi:hypothetical protein
MIDEDVPLAPRQSAPRPRAFAGRRCLFLTRLGLALVLFAASGCSDSSDSSTVDDANPLVTQFFAIFNDDRADNFHAALALEPPFQQWDITFIAFLHTFDRAGTYVADYENARGHDDDGEPIAPAPGDADPDRIRQLIDAALAVNPRMKFIVSLGWGRDDFENGAKNPAAFAASVGDIVEENHLDGFDVDYESVDMNEATFRTVSRALRDELDARGRAMGKRLLLTITPAQTDGLDFAAVDQHYDYVQMQTYDASDDQSFAPSHIVGKGIPGSKILFGRDIEGGDTLISSRYHIPDVTAYVRKNGLAGLMGWRVNAGNQLTAPYFSGVHLLRQAFEADEAEQHDTP